MLSLLVALPLLWMAWVLAANLAGLLMLNERRTLGLMRLRGISGQAMGRALLIADCRPAARSAACSAWSCGSVVPLLVYERGGLPLGRADPAVAAAALRRLPGHLGRPRARRQPPARALRDDDLAARGVAPRVGVGGVRGVAAFGALQALALVLGIYVLFGWTFDFSLSSLDHRHRRCGRIDRGLDFLGLPLFLYGVATLLASKRERIQRVMAPIVRPIGGRLGRFAVRHISVEAAPHGGVPADRRADGGVSLYPTITSRSFADKAERGARVQLGTDWQLLYNAPDLADVGAACAARRRAAAGAAAGDRASCSRAAAACRACAIRDVDGRGGAPELLSARATG